MNGPLRIGNATVLPGDVVLGAREGVTFVPPHLAEEVVRRSEDVRQRDVFGKSRIADGIYTSGQIDVSVWADEIEEDFRRWVRRRNEEVNADLRFRMTGTCRLGSAAAVIHTASRRRSHAQHQWCRPHPASLHHC